MILKRPAQVREEGPRGPKSRPQPGLIVQMLTNFRIETFDDFVEVDERRLSDHLSCIVAYLTTSVALRHFGTLNLGSF